MQTHIGVMMIRAVPMTRIAYNLLRGWALPTNENGDDEGYLVEHMDGEQANHPDFEGYISWSPKDVFDRAYKPTTGLTFGLAIEAMRLGFKVAREGWNGKGMWISISGHGVREVPAGAFWSENNSQYAAQQGGLAKVLPCITMKTATGEILMGWLASQTDILALDWEIVP